MQEYKDTIHVLTYSAVHSHTGCMVSCSLHTYWQQLGETVPSVPSTHVSQLSSDSTQSARGSAHRDGSQLDDRS